MPRLGLYMSTRALLVAFITMILVLSYTNVYVYSRSISEEFLSLYEEIVNLAREGVDVSYMVSNLSAILESTEQNQSISQISELTKLVKNAIEELKRDAPRITLYRDTARALTVVFLASMPIAFYILFPRLYLYAWFITRRKWVVKSGSNR